MKIRTPKRIGISKGIGLFLIGSICLVMNPSPEVEAIDFTTSHLGTYKGETTFTTSSSTGISPSLTLEVDGPHDSGKRYEAQSGSLTLSETEEGATIKSAILKGQTLVNVANTIQKPWTNNEYALSYDKKYTELSVNTENVWYQSCIYEAAKNAPYFSEGMNWRNTRILLS